MIRQMHHPRVFAWERSRKINQMHFTLTTHQHTVTPPCALRLYRRVAMKFHIPRTPKRNRFDAMLREVQRLRTSTHSDACGVIVVDRFTAVVTAIYDSVFPYWQHL